MKKIIFTCVLSVISAMVLAQQTNTWRFGASLSGYSNESVYKGGMEEANARFHHNEFGGGSLQWLARYDYNRHWMITGGIGFYTIGFDYSLAENYSLITQKNRFSSISTDITVGELPLMLHYKFKPACTGAKFVLGAGYVHTWIGAQTVRRSFRDGPEGFTNSNYLTSLSFTTERFNPTLRFTVGGEKEFKHGNILNLALVLNYGMYEIARSKVIYTVGGKEYQHEFSNTGNFAGIKISYFFRPFWRNTTVN